MDQPKSSLIKAQMQQEKNSRQNLPKKQKLRINRIIIAFVLFAIVVYGCINLVIYIQSRISSSKETQSLQNHEATSLNPNETDMKCKSDDLTANLTIDRTKYRVDEVAFLKLELTNNSPQQCRIRTSVDNQALKITSNGKTVVDLGKCDLEKANYLIIDKGLLLQPNNSYVQTLKWDFSGRGESGCDDGPKVAPGLYDVSFYYVKPSALKSNQVNLVVQ